MSRKKNITSFPSERKPRADNDRVLQQILYEINEEISQTLALARIKISTVEARDAVGQRVVENSYQLIGRAIKDLRKISTALERHKNFKQIG